MSRLLWEDCDKMMFCPKCGGIIVPRPGKKTKTMSCGCGYRVQLKGEKHFDVLKESVSLDKKDQIEVVDRKIDARPKTEEECPKCGHREAYFWTVQTRASDEAETRFFECTKCRNRWRQFS